GLQTIIAAAQILAETKNRMKGAVFSRVLLELALVRIATLDQLDNLAELIGQLRPGKSTGGGPAAPSVARATATPPQRQAGRAESSSADSAPASQSQNTIPVRLDPGHAEDCEGSGMPIAHGGGRSDSAVQNPGSSASAGQPATREELELI